MEVQKEVKKCGKYVVHCKQIEYGFIEMIYELVFL